MKGRSVSFQKHYSIPPPVSRPDLLFFGFCFLFFILYHFAPKAREYIFDFYAVIFVCLYFSPLSLASLDSPSCAYPIFAARRSGRLQKPERCATHSSLLRPLDAVAVRAPAGRAKFTPVGRGKPCGKTNFFQLFLTTNFAKTDAGTLASPAGHMRTLKGVVY